MPNRPRGKAMVTFKARHDLAAVTVIEISPKMSTISPGSTLTV